MAYSPNSVYISEDGLVTFDQYGRKLDSLGNVAWDDTQGAWGANAKPIERPQVQQMQQQPQAQQAATPIVKAATGAYSPSASATPTNAPARPWADPMPPMTALGQPQSQGFRPQPPMPQPMPQQPPMQQMQSQPPIPQYWGGQQQMAPPEAYNPYDFNAFQQTPYSSAWKPSW